MIQEGYIIIRFGSQILEPLILSYCHHQQLNNNKRETRSLVPYHLTFTTKRCKTTTYQRSYFNRSTRLWNILPRDLTGKNKVSLTQFKYGPFSYYKLALKNVCNVLERGNLYVCLVTRVVRSLSFKISCSY